MFRLKCQRRSTNAAASKRDELGLAANGQDVGELEAGVVVVVTSHATCRINIELARQFVRR